MTGIVALVWIRDRNSWSRLGLAVSIALSGVSLFVCLKDRLDGAEEGVLIVDEAYGRKGPGYAYSSAFSGPLHNGIELQVTEQREDWLKAELPDGSECWLPSEAVSRLQRL